MKILLLSDSEAVLNVVSICLDKPGFELAINKDDLQEFDLVIKDVEKDEELNFNEFNKENTLFLLPKKIYEESNLQNKLLKPFLPIKLTEFLQKFEKSDESVNLNDKNLSCADSILAKSVELTKDSGDDFQALNDILDDINDIDEENLFDLSKNDEIPSTIQDIQNSDEELIDKEKFNDESVDVNNIFKIVSENENIPLSEIAKEFSVEIEESECDASNEICNFKNDIKTKLQDGIEDILLSNIDENSLKNIKINISISFEDK